MTLTVWLLILHGLIAVAVLGALTHQTVALFAGGRRGARSFAGRYASVSGATFTGAVAALFAVDVLLGAVIYPVYRIDVRIPLEEMGLAWVAGTFELKEHFAGLGLGLLPAYLAAWREPAHAFAAASPAPAAAGGADASDARGSSPSVRTLRLAVTLPLAFVVWWNFVAGHVINNVRGLP